MPACKKCQTALRDEARFCDHCGASLSGATPSHGSTLGKVLGALVLAFLSLVMGGFGACLIVMSGGGSNGTVGPGVVMIGMAIGCLSAMVRIIAN